MILPLRSIFVVHRGREELRALQQARRYKSLLSSRCQLRAHCSYGGRLKQLGSAFVTVKKNSFATEGPLWRNRQHPALDPYEQRLSELPVGIQIHLDFFGEPMTFSGVASSEMNKSVSSAVASLDGFIIGVASKGKSFTGGGEEEGIFVQGAHSSALAWSDLLRYASLWNSTPSRSAPMLAYAAVAPILAQTGVAYIRYLDSLLCNVDAGVEGSPLIQLFELAQRASSERNNKILNQRERNHLQALHCLLHHDHKRALLILLRLLQKCPGDGLALSMALDLAHVTGDSSAALQAAGSVAAYWNERRGGLLRPSIPGYYTASALIAVGLAAGGRRQQAESLATCAMEKGEKLAGGIATWALAIIFDAEGRTAEGISTCANSDGYRNFETCGFLFFDAILAGYGARFSIDREERGRGRSKALRLYDNHYDRVFDSTGFASGVAWKEPSRPAPLAWRQPQFDSWNGRNKFMTELFAPASKNGLESKGDDNELVAKEDTTPQINRQGWIPSVEDVLTWIPPSPQLLCHATLLLLRLTLNGTVSTKNYRWENLRKAWFAMFDIQEKYGGRHTGLEFFPLACVTSSLLIAANRKEKLSFGGEQLIRAFHKMGELMNLGTIEFDENSQKAGNGGVEGFLSTGIFKEIVADKEPEFWLPLSNAETKNEWRAVFKLLSAAVDGVYDPAEGNEEIDVMRAELARGFEESWEHDMRPVLEHALVYAACKCGDYDTLTSARSVCSRGVTLRSNSPEEWWRYSIVLGLLGDEVASENALQASLAFGGGQGARRDD